MRTKPTSTRLRSSEAVRLPPSRPDGCPGLPLRRIFLFPLGGFPLSHHMTTITSTKNKSFFLWASTASSAVRFVMSTVHLTFLILLGRGGVWTRRNCRVSTFRRATSPTPPSPVHVSLSYGIWVSLVWSVFGGGKWCGGGEKMAVQHITLTRVRFWHGLIHYYTTEPRELWVGEDCP
jgi:hypothetical protein